LQTLDVISPAYPVIGALLVFVVASMADSNTDACQRVAMRYEIAAAAITDALHSYEKCIAASRGRDTCSAEFSDLDVAQDRFETAVSESDERCR
jgi:hypothetical protein